MTLTKPDILNTLAGIGDQSAIAQLRASRSETTGFAQASYLALLEPDDPGEVSRVEREAIGLRVATLERSQVVADFHTGRLLALGQDEAFIAAITDFPEGFTGSRETGRHPAPCRSLDHNLAQWLGSGHRFVARGGARCEANRDHFATDRIFTATKSG